MIAAAVLIGAVWLLGLGRGKGEGYYFPTWQWGEAIEEEQAERMARLNDVSQVAPIAVSSMERGLSDFGVKWEEVRENLPDGIRSRVPKYIGPRWDALAWLVSHANHPLVAAGMVERWNRMDADRRHWWILQVEPESVRQRREYQPLLRQIAAYTQPVASMNAASLLAAFDPISDGDAQIAAGAMERNGAYAGFGFCLRLAERILDHRPIPPELIKVLESWSNSDAPGCGAAGGVALALLDPVKYPPERVLEPHWRKLPAQEGEDMLSALGRTRFEPLMRSAWGVGFVGELLLNTTNRSKTATLWTTPRTRTLLQCIERMGTNAAALAPRMVPLLSWPDLQRESAAVFAAIAGSDARWIELVVPGLTNAKTSGPLLLWLTSLGPKARSARETVHQLAEAQILFPPLVQRNLMMDPVLAKRYGLIPAASEDSLRNSRSPTVRRPGEVRIKAADVCPVSLVAFWPQSVLGSNRSPSDETSGASQDIRARLPDSNLAELAQRCLAAMDAAPTAEKPDSANRSANQ